MQPWTTRAPIPWRRAGQVAAALAVLALLGWAARAELARRERREGLAELTRRNVLTTVGQLDAAAVAQLAAAGERLRRPLAEPDLDAPPDEAPRPAGPPADAAERRTAAAVHCAAAGELQRRADQLLLRYAAAAAEHALPPASPPPAPALRRPALEEECLRRIAAHDGSEAADRAVDEWLRALETEYDPAGLLLLGGIHAR